MLSSRAPTLVAVLALLCGGPVQAAASPKAHPSIRPKIAGTRTSTQRPGRETRRHPSSLRAPGKNTRRATLARRRRNLRRAVAKRTPGRRPIDNTALRRMRSTLPRPDHRAGIRQITGKDLVVGQTSFEGRYPADPFVDVLPDGRVHVYGTFESYIEFDSLDDMLRGGPHRLKPIETDEYLANEASWDHMIHRWDGGKEVMYGGVMTPTDGRARPAWPADNWTRRIYAFTRNREGKWVRHPKPLFGAVRPNQKPGMVGHAYGHHFKTVKRAANGRTVQETWLFHEEIVSERPMRTEIFARKMLDPFTAAEEKVKILGVDIDGEPTLGRRQKSEEYLVEGPRPFEVDIAGETFHFVSFSSSDFNSDNYDLNFAWRKGDAIGEYKPYLLQKNGKPTLRGFAERLKKRYQLSWVGRADVVRDGRGDYWAVFHGVDKRIRPEIDYRKQSGDLGTFQRNIYAVPLRFSKAKDGTPRIELLDRPQD